MIKLPKVRVVYDRKRQATNEKAALIQIEVLYDKKKKYIGTGIRVTKDCWSKKLYVQNCLMAQQYRKRILYILVKIDEYISGLIEADEPWSWTSFDSFVATHIHYTSERETFLEFVVRYKEERSDIRESTRKTHNKLINALEEFGKIQDYNNLTRANILAFDDYLRQREHIGSATHDAGVYNYHKLLRAYINEALRRELAQFTNPYNGLKLKKGESKMHGWLSMEDIGKIRDAEMPTAGINKVRDFAMLQYYTGLAYTDLFSLNKDMFEVEEGRYVLKGERRKTGCSFYVVLMPPAVEILERYGWKLPPMTNQQYNMRLKIVATAAGIDKQISSHWLRRSAGMFYLNAGMPIEVVSKILGHSNIRTTQKAYAHILDKTVFRAFDKLFRNDHQ